MSMKVKKAKGYLLFSWRLSIRNILIIVSFLALLSLFYLSSSGNGVFGVKLCPGGVAEQTCGKNLDTHLDC